MMSIMPSKDIARLVAATPGSPAFDTLLEEVLSDGDGGTSDFALAALLCHTFTTLAQDGTPIELPEVHLSRQELHALHAALCARVGPSTRYPWMDLYASQDMDCLSRAPRIPDARHALTTLVAQELYRSASPEWLAAILETGAYFGNTIEILIDEVEDRPELHPFLLELATRDSFHNRFREMGGPRVYETRNPNLLAEVLRLQVRQFAEAYHMIVFPLALQSGWFQIMTLLRAGLSIRPIDQGRLSAADDYSRSMVAKLNTAHGRISLLRDALPLEQMIATRRWCADDRLAA